MKVKCLKCGAEICVSKYDYKNGSYPKYCPKCSVVGKVSEPSESVSEEPVFNRRGRKFDS